MKDFAAQDENYELRVRESFSKQNLMKTIGATLTKVLPGEVDISLEFRDDLTQQHGFIHAGVVATLSDTACGYAALSLMAPDAAVLTVEYEINLLSPAVGESLIACGKVTKSGRTLTVCSGDVFAFKGRGRDHLFCQTLRSTALPYRPPSCAKIDIRRLDSKWLALSRPDAPYRRQLPFPCREPGIARYRSRIQV